MLWLLSYFIHTSVLFLDLVKCPQVTTALLFLNSAKTVSCCDVSVMKTTANRPANGSSRDENLP